MSPSLGDARAEPPLQLARGVEPALCALPSESGYFVAGRPKTLPYEVPSVFEVPSDGKAALGDNRLSSFKFTFGLRQIELESHTIAMLIFSAELCSVAMQKLEAPDTSMIRSFQQRSSATEVAKLDVSASGKQHGNRHRSCVAVARRMESAPYRTCLIDKVDICFRIK